MFYLKAQIRLQTSVLRLIQDRAITRSMMSQQPFGLRIAQKTDGVSSKEHASCPWGVHKSMAKTYHCHEYRRSRPCPWRESLLPRILATGRKIHGIGLPILCGYNTFRLVNNFAPVGGWANFQIFFGTI